MTSEFPDHLALANRSGLPDALRVLLADFPREGWQAHPNFGEMVQFWLKRHLMFRELLDRLETEAEAVIDAQTDLAAYRPRLSRLGGFFLQELHTHHHVEDDHYFPRLITLDDRLTRGFGLLDADHHALDELLNGFATSANAVLGAQTGSAARDATGNLFDRLKEFQRLLNRHLTDEEDLIVPVILKTGFSG